LVANVLFLSRHYNCQFVPTFYGLLEPVCRNQKEDLGNLSSILQNHALLIQYKTTTLRSIYTKPGYLPQARLDKPCQIYQKLKLRSKGRCQFCRFRNEVLSKRLEIIGGMLQDRRVRQSFTTCKHCCVYLCGNCFDLFYNFKSIL
jgi:hypothetical protein